MNTFSSPLFMILIALFIAIVIKQHYKLSTNRILILFFLPPIIFSILGELYDVLLSGDIADFNLSVFGMLFLLYIILFLPLLTVSIAMVYIQKVYAPSLLKQLFIISVLSIVAMALFFYFINKPLYPSLFASIGYMITVGILYYLTDVKNIVK